MAVFDTAEANRLLEATVGRTTYPATVGPIKVDLVTATGSDSAAGTVVTGGSYAIQSITTWNAAASRAITNNTAASYTGMPAVTVTGIDCKDSAGTPVRKIYGALAASKTTAAGDTLTLAGGAPGAISVSYG